MLENFAKISFKSASENESFARCTAAAFIAQLDPTIEVLADIKTAVSEAVTNAIIHGYDGVEGTIDMELKLEDGIFTVTVSDSGKGILDIDLARKPLYTGKPDSQRSGMGFTVMESFMDTLSVASAPGCGTKVTMSRAITR